MPLVTLLRGAQRTPNLAATGIELYDGLAAESQNRWPSLAFDVMAVNGVLAPFLPAGFYYKTFMGPTRGAWRFYEHFIRRAAGLGRGVHAPDPDVYDKRHGFADVLVIGGGPAGLAAALAAGRAGARVMLVDQQATFGGALLERGDEAGEAWRIRVLDELGAMDNVQRLNRASAFGCYDGNTVGVIEAVAEHMETPPPHQPRQRYWQLHAAQIVIATGALERPLPFADNDPPGRDGGGGGARISEPLCRAGGAPHRRGHQQRQRLRRCRRTGGRGCLGGTGRCPARDAKGGCRRSQPCRRRAQTRHGHRPGQRTPAGTRRSAGAGGAAGAAWRSGRGRPDRQRRRLVAEFTAFQSYRPAPGVG